MLIDCQFLFKVSTLVSDRVLWQQIGVKISEHVIVYHAPGPADHHAELKAMCNSTSFDPTFSLIQGRLSKAILHHLPQNVIHIWVLLLVLKFDQLRLKFDVQQFELCSIRRA